MSASLSSNGINANAGGARRPDGLDIFAPNTTVEGLAINRFTGEGINQETSNPQAANPILTGNDTIQGNFIGTDPTGTVAEGNGLDGVLIQAYSNGNSILDNLISGNQVDGIFLNGNVFAVNKRTVTTGNLTAGQLDSARTPPAN